MCDVYQEPIVAVAYAPLQIWEQRRVKTWGDEPKNDKTICSSGEIKAPAFWDYQEIIFINYMKKGESVWDAQYASLLGCLKNELQKNLSPAYSSALVVAKLMEFGSF